MRYNYVVGAVRMMGVTLGENLTVEMRGSVRKMGVSPGETDNMD